MDLGSVTKGIKEFVEVVTYFLIKEAIFISLVCLPGLDNVDNKSTMFQKLYRMTLLVGRC